MPFAAVLLPLGYYSLASSHDVHAESRLAFQAGRDLIAQGIPPAKINGGYAFDGWHLYETHSGPVPVRPLPPWWGYRGIWDDWNWWAASSDILLNSPEAAWWSGPVRPPGEVDYLVSVSSPKIRLDDVGPRRVEAHGGNPLKFAELRQYPFVSGWRGRTKFVYVLQRLADEPVPDSASSEKRP